MVHVLFFGEHVDLLGVFFAEELPDAGDDLVLQVIPDYIELFLVVDDGSGDHS